MNRLKEFREKIFSLRGYTPLPFLLVMLIFAEPTAFTMSVGFLMTAAGESLRFWGVGYAGSLTRVTGQVGAPEVVMAGPFAYVRNPLYLGNMLIYVGIGIMANAFFPWLVIIAAAWFAFQYYQIVMLEEDFLKKEFSSKYYVYAYNVPRFLPRLSPFIHPDQSNQHLDCKSALHSEQRTLQALALVLLTLVVLLYLR
jgi:protein-S-isoprenylcysteine O-methyltransferase Ste14